MGGNVIDKIQCNKKIGYDIHKQLIALLIYARDYSCLIPDTITEEEYNRVKLNKGQYEDWYLGLVGFCATFGAKYFGGYARGGKGDNSGEKTKSAIRNLKKQAPNLQNIEFKCCDYSEIISNEKDLLYLDPPYAGTRGMYYGTLELEPFFNWLRKQKGFYLLSFDGKSGEVDNTYDLPSDLYSEHKYMLSGNSSFKRTIGKSNDSIVYESLYIK